MYLLICILFPAFFTNYIWTLLQLIFINYIYIVKLRIKLVLIIMCMCVQHQHVLQEEFGFIMEKMNMKEDWKCAIMGNGNQLHIIIGIILMQKWLANSCFCFKRPAQVRYKCIYKNHSDLIIADLLFHYFKYFFYRDHMEACITYWTTESWPQMHWIRTKIAGL